MVSVSKDIRILLNVIIIMTSCIIMYDVQQSYLLGFNIVYNTKNQYFRINMTFISLSEVKNVYFI